MYQHILVPVSFDEDHNTTGAVAVAQLLAPEGVHVTLLHVMQQVPKYAANYIPEGFQDEARQAIEDSLASLGADLAEAEGVVIEGPVGKSILKWGEAHDVDCIIVASQKPSVQDVLLGSTATHVARHARCAVHLVR
ncbi:nucleotide-binding universal stress UspA family protein [Shimia isoporae]|uniref:Nucleotide-binding universal stress UspA family protein n=1 Tax=Shimia isoporae TaxID=647720 RepID=A0A4R1N0U1_9RHOB|nr:universal stress protein [Shimia isoporae]TCK99314.1 nucleotide-binding universal stress UspA family protein [Shimia isoporae]